MSASGRRKTLAPGSLIGTTSGKSRAARKRKTLDPEECARLKFGSNVSIVFGQNSKEEEENISSEPRDSKQPKLDQLGVLPEASENSIANSRPVRRAARNSLVNRRLSARIAKGKTTNNRRNSMAYAVLTNKMGQKNSTSQESDMFPLIDSFESNQRRLSLPSLHERTPLEDITDSNQLDQKSVASSSDPNSSSGSSRSSSQPSLVQRTDSVAIPSLYQHSNLSKDNSSISSSQSSSQASLSSIASASSANSIGSSEAGTSHGSQESLKTASGSSSQESSKHSEQSSASSSLTTASSQYYDYHYLSASSCTSQYSSSDSGLNRLVNNGCKFESKENVSTEEVEKIVDPGSVTPEKAAPIVESPTANNKSVYNPLRVKRRSAFDIFCTRTRGSPLPPLTWAKRKMVWRSMCMKELEYKRSPYNLDGHPAILSNMRAILFDWICEVSEVYKLHRETYYLATDLVDRYLLKTTELPKQQLQLIGITCLFMAAKIEEIYPPKISDFAYVTDGACDDAQITEKEIVILGALEWRLAPMTPIMWLNTYLQLLQEMMRKKGDEPSVFVIRKFSGDTFIEVTRLLDLTVLEVTSLQFSPSELAAAALSCFFGTEVACKVSWYNAADLEKVQRWMGPFAAVVQELPELGAVKVFRGVPNSDAHNIQTKVVEMETLEKAQVLLKAQLEEEHRMILLHKQQLQAEQARLLKKYEDTPLSRAACAPFDIESPSVLTPPKSDEKLVGEGGCASIQPCHPKPVFNEKKLEGGC